MKKSGLLARLEQLRLEGEDKELEEITKTTLLDLLLDYINDPQIREAVERIPF